MEDWLKYLLAVAVIFGVTLLVFGAYLFAKHVLKKEIFDVKFMARTGIFAAISIILYIVPIFNFELPIFPSFLKIHLDEIPVFLAGFSYGPWSAIIILVVKTLAKLPMTSTLAVGELADLIYSLAFVVPAAVIYKYHRTLVGALISILSGIVIQLVVATTFTTFVMLPFYIWLMPFITEESLLAMCQAINPNITNLNSAFLFGVSLPFNALKDAMVVVPVMILYKRLMPLINKIGEKK